MYSTRLILAREIVLVTIYRAQILGVRDYWADIYAARPRAVFPLFIVQTRTHAAPQ